MADVHGVKRILDTIFDAIDSEYGGEVRDGLRLHLPKQFSLVVTRLDNDMIDVHEVMEDHPVIQQVLMREPDIGAGDESKCLPGWLDTFCNKWAAGEAMTLSHNAVGAICHTLIAARQRARRLVKERDDARSA